MARAPAALATMIVIKPHWAAAGDQHFAGSQVGGKGGVYGVAEILLQAGNVRGQVGRVEPEVFGWA